MGVTDSSQFSIDLISRATPDHFSARIFTSITLRTGKYRKVNFFNYAALKATDFVSMRTACRIASRLQATWAGTVALL
ncbi:hypothetical protein WT77_19775 [Burkholderia stagnalis]|nr:hypothetical protein WS59_05155 [Burkholderia stagnalis]KVN11290.1 hypothetical protein WT10_29780 [Burkholderia stagnalis]KVO58718.1 hypothetical protein WT18_16365 [Burkholderia stagnalis]KVP02639.1 hypothetical protein WT20_31855 [Burkholderia stagnalis]KVW98462.1 hypothetical protein WT30_06130 [Burkholderia stagnalis]